MGKAARKALVWQASCKEAARAAIVASVVLVAHRGKSFSKRIFIEEVNFSPLIASTMSKPSPNRRTFASFSCTG